MGVARAARRLSRGNATLTGLADMMLLCGEDRYETDQLLALPTGDAATPVVYITRDLLRVLVVTVDGYKGRACHRADEAEVKQLAARHNLPQLLMTLRK